VRRAKRWPGSAAAAALIAATALAGCGSSKRAANQPLTGTYQLFATFDTGKPTPPCDGTGTAKTGDTVTVQDADDHVIATGTLGPPQSFTRQADQRNLTTQLACNWPFTTGAVRNGDSYRVQVGSYIAQTFTHADFVNAHWRVTIEEERNVTGQ
jgi:hypothetical protein